MKEGGKFDFKIKAENHSEFNAKPNPNSQKRHFYKIQEFARSKFSRSYQLSNIFSRYAYSYVIPTLDRMNAKDCKIDVEDIEDMNRDDDPKKLSEDKTVISIDSFKKVMESEI